MDETLLYSLLGASLVSSVLLLLISTAIVGRKLADLEYQKANGLSEVSQIQAIVNIRTHVLRTFVGLTFIIISSLLLADAPVIWRSWINRTLFVLLPTAYAVASYLDWQAERKQIKLRTEEAARARATSTALAVAEEYRRLAALQADRDSYKDMASEAIASLSLVASRARDERGEAPIAPLAPVVPEHSSPVTPEQREAAEVATLRADLTASTLDLGLPPRETQPAPTRAAAITPAIGQSLGDMEAAAGETLEAANKTVVAAQSAVEAIEDERAGREGP